MITAVVTFITTRIVAVFVTTVVVVATVPSVIILIHGNTITITAGTVASGSRDQDDRTRITIEVKTAGDDVTALLNQEEASCDSQVAQLASVSVLSLADTDAAIEKGKGEFHSDVKKFEDEIRSDEDGFDRGVVVSTQTEDVVLERLLQIRITALGDNGSTGVLITSCQAVLVEIRQIVITVIAPSGGDDEDSD